MRRVPREQLNLIKPLMSLPRGRCSKNLLSLILSPPILKGIWKNVLLWVTRLFILALECAFCIFTCSLVLFKVGFTRATFFKINISGKQWMGNLSRDFFERNNRSLFLLFFFLQQWNLSLNSNFYFLFTKCTRKGSTWIKQRNTCELTHERISANSKVCCEVMLNFWTRAHMRHAARG